MFLIRLFLTFSAAALDDDPVSSMTIGNFLAARN